mmetsp:Transcript_25692/g.86349  ORF Transcript_25692/g.86349 Transcript_25692/m.86349 type:complete len:141 (+) Transcript_25692:3-425(+)
MRSTLPTAKSSSEEIIMFKAAILALLIAPSAALTPTTSRRNAFKNAVGTFAGVAAASAIAAPVNALDFAYNGKPDMAVKKYGAEPGPKFSPKENWNTLYPPKKLQLEKKSPVDRTDLAAGSGYETVKRDVPGLAAALAKK